MYTLLSVLVVTIGLVLMTYKIHADSEPGLIPILLVVLGSGFLQRDRVAEAEKFGDGVGKGRLACCTHRRMAASSASVCGALTCSS